MNLAKKPPLKERMQWVADYYANAFQRLGVEVQLNTEVTADTVAALQPDAVVVATGSKSVVPDSIPGVHGSNVHTIEEVLSEKISLSGKQVVVIGAGNTGIETA